MEQRSLRDQLALVHRAWFWHCLVCTELSVHRASCVSR